MSLIKDTVHKFKNFVVHDDFFDVSNNVIQCSSFLQKINIFTDLKIIKLKILDTTILHQRISLLQNKKAYFKITKNTEFLGEIAISSLLFTQHGIEKSDLNSTVFHPQYYKNNKEFPYFTISNPPDKLKKLWYKQTIYHEFGHAYQSYLKNKNQSELHSSLNSNELMEKTNWIMNVFPFELYGYANINSMKETFRGYLSAIYQEMYADNFSLLCLGKELNFNQTFVQMAHALKDSRTGNYNENYILRHDNHTTYHSLNYFDINIAKNLNPQQYHEYASENTVKGFLDFLKLLKNELSLDKIKIINEFENETSYINNSLSKKLKNFINTDHQFKI